MRDILVFLMFMAPSLQGRVSVGGASVALMEPAVLLASAGLLAHELVQHRLRLSKERILVPIFGLVLWASIVRPLGMDWGHGLSDVRDWAIPLIALVVLLSARNVRWRRWTHLFVVGAVLNADVGI